MPKNHVNIKIIFDKFENTREKTYIFYVQKEGCKSFQNSQRILKSKNSFLVI